MRSPRPLATRWWKPSVVALTVVALVALGYGPTRYLLAGEHDATPDSLSLFGDPYAAPRLGTWPTGVVDTATGDGVTGSAERRAPRGRLMSVEQATATVPTTAYVDVTGPPSGRRMPGVGSVVTRADVRTLLDLDEPSRTDVLRYLTSPGGAALGLVAMDEAPSASARLVDADSNEHRRRLLDAGDPSVKELIDLWAQQRPDLSVLVSRPDDTRVSEAVSGVGLPTDTSQREPSPASAATKAAVAATAGQVLSALRDRDPVVSAALLSSSADEGLFTLDGGRITPTRRGQAFITAALAVPPGSRQAPTVATGGLTTLAFQRPRGGASVLVWNPGTEQRITIDLPYGGDVHRVRVKVAGGALTAVLLRR